MASEIDNPTEPSAGLTVGQFCEYIAPSVWSDESILHWPPDVFAIVGALLLKSGSYAHAVSGWRRDEKLREWVERMRHIGKA